MFLASLINHPERLNRDTLYELRSVVARHPYFQTARLLMLNNMYLLHEPDFGTELRRSVLYVYDRRALCRLIEGDFGRVEPVSSTVPEEPTVDRTMSLIDAFLGAQSEEPADALQLPVDVVGDYVSQYLADEGETLPVPPLEEGDSAIADIAQVLSGIVDSKTPSQRCPKFPLLPERAGEEDLLSEMPKQPELSDEGCFTETLAKIYIKQHKYSRALEIIRGLYLKYPEKNIYFADQIRFLEKLIINNNSK